MAVVRCDGPCELWVVRHAESEHNADGRVQGWLDSPLSGNGRLQAVRAAALLAEERADAENGAFAAIVASDLRRASDTARLIAEGLGWERSRVALDARLREYDTGLWSGQTTEEIETLWPGQLESWRARRLAAPPEGEQRAAFASRVLHALAAAVEGHAGRHVLVVSHGGVLRALERRAGLPSRPLGNLSGRRLLAWPDGTWEAGPPIELDRRGPAVNPAVPVAAGEHVRADHDRPVRGWPQPRTITG